MGCDTKGFIATDKKDIWEVVGAIKDFLKTRPSKKDNINLRPFADNGADYRLMDFCKSITVNFRDGEDYRTLWVHFDCDCDQEEVFSGPKIIFSLGCWGKCDEIIKGVLEKLKYLGRAFYISNDCGDEDYQELI